MKSSFGPTLPTTQRLQTVFAEYPEAQEVWLYGSRAKCTAKEGSDIDLGLKGE